LAYALLNLGEWAVQREGRSDARSGRDSGSPPGNDRHRAAALIGPLLAVVAVGCFTDPINRPPFVRIDPLIAAALRQQPVTFHAQASDPDGDQPRLKWAVVSGDCTPDSPPDASLWVVPPDDASFMVDGDKTNGPFCVWVMATDAHNATASYHLVVNPQDQAPIAMIEVISPDPAPLTPMTSVTSYSLYSTIQLSSKGTSDPEGDVLAEIMALTQKPGGSTAALGTCNATAPSASAGPSDLVQCFVADVAGEYDVLLTATDPANAQGTASRTIFVLPDQPPCIRSSTPAYMSPIVEVTLSSSPSPPTFTITKVADDGAPWPNGGTEFRWYVSSNGQPFQFINNDYPALALTSTGLYKAGDEVKVRVEVSDHNPTNDAALFGCADDNDLCEMVPGSGCFQRVTWSVDFR